MRVAGREKPVSHRKVRCEVERCQQARRRLVEPSAEEIGFADAVKICREPVTRVEPEIILEMPESDFGLAGKNPEQPAPIPAVGMARVEGEATVDQTQ